MNYLFDTSILLEINRGNSKIVESIGALSVNTESSPAISTLTYGEFYFGLIDMAERDKQEGIDFLASFQLFTINKTSARIWAELRKRYQKLGKSLPAIDLFIAAIAIEQGRCLLTRDKGFQAIEELQKIIL